MNYCRGAVIFPHNIGLGAANDADIMYEIGAATADEAKLAGMLWNFAPCVAVSTDPRWGRTYESCSSDPEIVGNLGTAYVRGLGDNGYLIDRGDANLNEEEIDELLGVYKKLIDAGVPKETCIRFTSRTIKYDEWTANKGRWNDTADEGDEEARLSDFAFIMEQAAYGAGCLVSSEFPDGNYTGCFDWESIRKRIGTASEQGRIYYEEKSLFSHDHYSDFPADRLYAVRLWSESIGKIRCVHPSRQR